jgi:hypothetical protein
LVWTALCPRKKEGEVVNSDYETQIRFGDGGILDTWGSSLRGPSELAIYDIVVHLSIVFTKAPDEKNITRLSFPDGNISSLMEVPSITE